MGSVEKGFLVKVRKLKGVSIITHILGLDRIMC